MSGKQKEIRKRKKKIEDLYLIWEYYHKLQNKNSPIKCVCKFCNKVYMCHMKRLINHLVGACKKCPQHIKTYMQTIEKKIVAKNEKRKEEERKCIDNLKTKDDIKGKDHLEGKDDKQNEDNDEEYSALEDLPQYRKTKRSKCFVYGCNRTRAEFAFFQAPDDFREREIWNSIITHPFQQRNLRSTDFICERHFAPSDVIRYLVVNGVRIPNKTPVLRRGCLPIKFFDDYVLKSYNRHITKLISISGVEKKRKRVDSDDDNKNTPRNSTNEVLTNTSEVIEELALNPEYEIEYRNEETVEKEFEKCTEIPDIQNEEIVIKIEPNDDMSLQDQCEIDIPNIDIQYNIDTLIKPELCDTDISNVKDEDSYDSNSSEDEDIENNFFERIFQTRSFPGLNEYWAICPCKDDVKPIFQHLVDDNKSVVFTQMNIKNAIPITEKQIVLTSDLKLDYFVGQNQITDLDLRSKISNTTELAAAINHYSSVKFCQGGPRINEIDIGFNPNTSTYYKDYSSQTWRHKRCMFLSHSGTVCLRCRYVKKYFKQKQKVLSIDQMNTMNGEEFDKNVNGAKENITVNIEIIKEDNLHKT